MVMVMAIYNMYNITDDYDNADIVMMRMLLTKMMNEIIMSPLRRRQ